VVNLSLVSVQQDRGGTEYAVGFRARFVTGARFQHVRPYSGRDNTVTVSAGFDERGPEPGYLYIYRKLDIALWRSALPESAGDPDGQFSETIAAGAGTYYDATASVVSSHP
jgi:hypothetical protein